MEQKQQAYAASRARPRKGAQRKMPKFMGSIAQLNRWTGKPHEHKREIARRLGRG